MKTLNLTTDTPELQRIKDYLQENASDTLADKINNGTPFEKDGKPLINKKNLDGFMQYASDEAKTLVDKNARYACVEDKTVFAWAIHYFEEDSIEGNLFYMDGTEYKPAAKAKPVNTPITTVKKTIKQPSMQFSLFDSLEESMSQEQDSEIENAVKGQVVTEEGKIIDYKDFDGDMDDEPEEEPIIAPAPIQEPKGNALYQRYKRLQDAYPDSIITMRLGDFYECFGESAVTLANELNLTLTGRDCGLGERIPMIGFPYHCADAYFKKINEVHNLVIAENSDKENKYLPRKKKTLFVVNDEATDCLKTIFGKDLEVEK